MDIQTCLYIERDGEEVELTIKGRYFPGDPGRCHGPVENSYAPQSEEVELEEVLIAGKPWAGTLSEKEEAEALDRLADQGRDA